MTINMTTFTYPVELSVTEQPIKLTISNLMYQAHGSDTGGAVSSVNGQTGTVNLSASDVGAATSEQGAKADSALQPSDVSTAGKTGNYNDLSNKPDLTLKQDKLPTTGTAGQFLAHDLTFKTPSGGSTVNEYGSTALASAWTGTNPSVLALTVTGLLATHKTVLDVDLSSVTFANIDGVQADYALIYRAVPTANTLTLYASKKPTKDLSLKLVVLNG